MSVESMNGNSKVKPEGLIECEIGQWRRYICWMHQNRQETNYMTSEWTEV